MTRNYDVGTEVPRIFQESQKTTATHRRQILTLKKIHSKCSVGGEHKDAFNTAFLDAVKMVLRLKRTEPVANRVVKFLYAYLDDISCAGPLRKGQVEEIQENIQLEPWARDFVVFFTQWLVQGADAKDKCVRYRVVQILSKCLPALIMTLTTATEGLEEQLLERFLTNQVYPVFAARAYDKEPSVRAQAVEAMFQFYRIQSALTLNPTPLSVLLDLLKGDEVAEVRKTVVSQLELDNPDTIEAIVQRCRDESPIVRIALYKALSKVKDFNRIFDEKQINHLLSCGLSDKDPRVKDACVRMLADRWLLDAESNIIYLVGFLNPLSNGEAVELAIQALLKDKPAINIAFPDAYWQNLTPITIFFARVVFQYYAQNDPEKFDDIFIEGQKLSFLVDQYLRASIECDDDQFVEVNYIALQLLEIAKLPDYADEMCRRGMLDTLRNFTLFAPEIEESQVTSIVKILKKLCINERDFIRVVSDLITDIREPLDFGNDAGDGNGDIRLLPKKINTVSDLAQDDFLPRAQLTESQRVCIEIKSLDLIKSLLLHISQDLQSNPAVYGLLETIILPACRDTDQLLLIAGVECLALCCILDPTLSSSNMIVFLNLIHARGMPTEVRSTAYSTLFDLLFVHGQECLKSGSNNEVIPALVDELQKSLDAFISADERDEEELSVLIVLFQGFSKLLLRNVLPANKASRVIRSFLLSYYLPAINDVSHIRQTLSYFFTMFSMTSLENQRMIAEEAGDVLCTLLPLAALNKDKMLPASVIAQQVKQWTDPATLRVPESARDVCLHAPIVLKMLETAVKMDDKADQKIITQGLCKFDVENATVPVAFDIMCLAQELMTTLDRPTQRTLQKMVTLLAPRVVNMDIPVFSKDDELIQRMTVQGFDMTDGDIKEKLRKWASKLVERSGSAEDVSKA